MPPLPPADLVLKVVLFGVVIPLATAAAVMALLVWRGRAGQVVGALLAMAAGFLAGNYFREAVEFRIDAERPLTVSEWFAASTRALTGATEEGATDPPTHYWLIWAAALAAVTGLLARIPRLPVAVGWVARAVVALVIARLLVDGPSRKELPWLWPALSLAILATWAVLETLAAKERGGWLPLSLGLAFTAAGAVLIHAHSARYTDVANLLAGGWFGVALVSWWRQAEVRCATPIAAVALPGLLLLGQQGTFSDVPATSFALAGLAPLALAPLLFVPVERRRRWGWRLLGLGLLLLPAVAAVVLAARAETLSFE